MRAISLTKKQIKRGAAIAAAAAATAAVIITAAVTSVGTKAQQRQVPIYRVERNDNKVAITFDVAWENSNTDELIDILDEHGAKATFFITGDWCDRCADDVKKFADAGHEIENHSDKHPHVEGINVNDLINDTRECSRKIKMITGREPTYYRAPYGEYDDSLLTTLDGMGLKTIQWDVDSVDWNKPTSEQITKKVLANTKSGSILLFHNDLQNTTEALPNILKGLKEKGFEFVTIDELVLHENYTIDANGEQQPTAQSLNLTDKQVEEVMAKYRGELTAAGMTEEQLEKAAKAVKSGDLSALPEELRPLAQEVIARIKNDTSDASTSTQSENTGLQK